MCVVGVKGRKCLEMNNRQLHHHRSVGLVLRKTEVRFNIAIIHPDIPISLFDEAQSHSTDSTHGQKYRLKNIRIISLSIARLGLFLYF